MARFPAGVAPDALTVASRRVLLDALDALDAHREALVLIGAQAVLVRTGDAPIATYTADADLGLIPSRLPSDPTLENAMAGAGFAPGGQPGIWVRPERIGDTTTALSVDLLVPESFAGRGRRGVTLPPHARTAMRRVAGIEAALVDHDPVLVESLDPEDGRRAVLNVAGVAALLVAKAFKIRDRLAVPRPGREADKDAGDVFRLMAAASLSDVRPRFELLLSHATADRTTAEGLALLRRQFGGRATDGTAMAVASLAGAVPGDRVRQVVAAFTAELPRA